MICDRWVKLLHPTNKQGIYDLLQNKSMVIDFNSTKYIYYIIYSNSSEVNDILQRWGYCMWGGVNKNKIAHSKTFCKV